MTPPPTNRDVRLAPHEFYWGVLDTQRLPRRRPLFNPARRRHLELCYLFEDCLPVPVESLHCVFVPLPATAKGRRRVLACALEPKRLLDAVADGAVRLGPVSIPTELDVPSDASAINLLRAGPLGRLDLEPSSVRATRRRTALLAGAALIACTLLVGFGASRRTSTLHAERRDLLAALENVYARVLPPAGPGAQPPAVRLASELAALRRSRGPIAGAKPPSAAADVPASLAALLAAWPRDVPARTESPSLSSSDLALTASVPGHADAQKLTDALRSVSGWVLDQPQVSAAKDAVRITLRLKPAPSPTDRPASATMENTP